MKKKTVLSLDDEAVYIWVRSRVYIKQGALFTIASFSYEDGARELSSMVWYVLSLNRKNAENHLLP